MRYKMTLFSALFVGLVTTGCNNVESSDEYKALLAERDSLKTEVVAAHGGFNQALNTINEIETALEEVRSQENMIMVANQEGDANKAVSEINAIQQTLQQNRDKIAQLEKQLADQGAQSKELNRMVSRLKKQLEEKDAAIKALEKQLEDSRVQIAELNNQVTDLNESIDSLSNNLDAMNVQNAAQQATIESQDALLNTVWISIAPKSTLIEKGILDKGGLFKSSEISKQGFDKSQFTEADKRELTLIPLNTKKPTMMTAHPRGSYQINTTDDGNRVLEILDKEAFWSMSNYLVVSIK